MGPTPAADHPKDKSRHPTDNSRHPTDKSRHPTDKSRHPTDKSRHQKPNNLKKNTIYVFYMFSTRIKDAGIAIRHSQGYTFSILQGPETDLREWNRWIRKHKNKKPNKDRCFLCKNMLRTSNRMKNTSRICWNR